MIGASGAAPASLNGSAGWFGPAVVAALVAALVSLLTVWLTGRRARQERHRILFAEAFEACASYCELPYSVRRANDPVRQQELSAEINALQARLNSHKARLRVEAPRVARAFEQLLSKMRDEVAGPQISEGWKIVKGELPPVDHRNAGSMDVRDVDLSAMRPFEDDYLLAVRDHLSLAPSWVHRASRAASRTGARTFNPVRRAPQRKVGTQADALEGPVVPLDGS